MAPPELDHPGQQQAAGGAFRRYLLLGSVVTMIAGGLSAPLFTRIYFLHGGTRIWLSSFLQSCGFPILLLPLGFSYLRQQRQGRESGGNGGGFFSMTGKATIASIFLGLVSGVNSYMYAYGSASLPLSTSSLLISTQIAFTAAFAYLIVKLRFTPYSINAVVLLVVGPIVLGLQANGDRPFGVSKKRYYEGFFVMIGAAAVYGLLMVLIEWTWKSMKKVKVTHVMVLEMQLILGVVGSIFCAVGMVINKDFQAIRREAKEYELGETKYRLVLAASAFCWQLMNVGFVGVIFCSSSLLAGILVAMLVPLGEVLPVLVLHEKFNGGKGVAMALAIWGFISYLYGEYRQHMKEKPTVADEGLELPTQP